MVSVRPIEELTTAEDGCFAFVPKTLGISIFYDTPGGSIEYEDFSAFSHPAGTILRFENTDQHNNVTPWSMRIVLDDSEQTLQWTTYEDHYDMWENIDRSPHRFYGFLESVDVGGFDQSKTVVKLESRCDYGAYGPMPYHSVTDGIHKTVLDPEFAVKVTAGNSSPAISINGVGHITSLYAHGINMSWRNWPVVTFVGKTLSGLIKQLSEWKYIYELEMDNNNYSKDASEFLEKLGITSEMIKELEQTEVMMPTERFIRGYGDPRHGFSETGILPGSIKSQLMRNIRYKTLSMLEERHPDHPSVHEALKEEERRIQIQRIVKWFYMFKPSIKEEDISTEFIYEDIYNRSQDHTAIIPVPANAVIYRDGVYAARFFDVLG